MHSLDAHIFYGVEQNILDPIANGLHVYCSEVVLREIKTAMDVAAGGCSSTVELPRNWEIDESLKRKIGPERRLIRVSSLQFSPVPSSDHGWQFYVSVVKDLPNTVCIYCSPWLSEYLGKAIESLPDHPYEILVWPTRGSESISRPRRNDPRTHLGFFWW
jgi:hypothetical protein